MAEPTEDLWMSLPTNVLNVWHYELVSSLWIQTQEWTNISVAQMVKWTKTFFTSQKHFEDFVKSNAFFHMTASVSHSLEGFLVRVSPQKDSSEKIVEIFQYGPGNQLTWCPAAALPQAATQTSLSQTAHVTTCSQLCPGCQQSYQTPPKMKRSGARKPFPNHCRNPGKNSISQDNSISPPSFWNIPQAQKKKRQVLHYLLLTSDGLREDGALPSHLLLQLHIEHVGLGFTHQSTLLNLPALTFKSLHLPCQITSALLLEGTSASSVWDLKEGS